MIFVLPEPEETNFIPLTHGCLVFPTLFIVFSSVYLFVCLFVCSFVETLVSVWKRDWFWVFDSAPLVCMSAFVTAPCCFCGCGYLV